EFARIRKLRRKVFFIAFRQLTVQLIETLHLSRAERKRRSSEDASRNPGVLAASFANDFRRLQGQELLAIEHDWRVLTLDSFEEPLPGLLDLSQGFDSFAPILLRLSLELVF